MKAALLIALAAQLVSCEFIRGDMKLKIDGTQAAQLAATIAEIRSAKSARNVRP
jgi:hypothetical protein